MPVECLDGVKLPVTKDNDWSNPVRINYTVKPDDEEEGKEVTQPNKSWY